MKLSCVLTYFHLSGWVMSNQLCLELEFFGWSKVLHAQWL